MNSWTRSRSSWRSEVVGGSKPAGCLDDALRRRIVDMEIEGLRWGWDMGRVVRDRKHLIEEAILS